MNQFIRVTRTLDSEGGEIYISKQQIIYLEEDKRHSQTYIYCIDREFKVIETVSEILSQN